ncbi:hypothetical protein, partial [Frigoribacterium sp. MCBA15_019]|uniref:hypothetical protein n=1 Tax=Frigoribacterium sp. MCBA15_019 TaxID=1898745 RepID=UPI0015A6E79E
MPIGPTRNTSHLSCCACLVLCLTFHNLFAWRSIAPPRQEGPPSHMKKTLKTAGALGLAAATIVTGLSFGPAAASATSAPESVRPIKLVFTQPSTALPYVAVTTNDPTRGTRAFATLEEASEAAWPFTYDTATKQIRGTDGTCVGIKQGTSAPKGSYLTSAACSTGQDFRWKDGSDSLTSAGGLSLTRPYYYGEYTAFPATPTPARMEEKKGLAFAPGHGFAALSAKVTNIDRAAKTATLEGTAMPNSAVIVNGAEQFLADDTGAWSATVGGLKLGSNPLHLTQWENGVQTGEYTLDAEIKVSPITATTAFGADRTDEAIVKGAAQPGATIVVRDSAGTEIGRTTASTNADGAWELEIPAPNAPGDYAVTAQQLIDGDDGGTATATIAYGAAVKIDTPVDGIAFDGGTLNMTGKGEIDASIEIREKGKDVPILAAGKVFQNGQWNLTTTKLDDGEHVLEVTQTGKGNNTTVSTVTLNPGAGEIAPVAVTNPAGPKAGYVPNTGFTFEGTGTKGKTIQVENKFGTPLGTTQVKDNNTWSWTRANMGTSTWTINFIQDKGETTQSTATVLNFKPSTDTPAPAPLVAVTNPADPKTGYVPNTGFTFEGTGTKGKTIQVENKFGTPLGTTQVKNDNTWSWT